MSPEKQRIAIAEACGWSRFETGPYDSALFGIEPGVRAPANKYRVPDYLTDLNAMHEAEAHLTLLQREQYWHELVVLVKQHGWGHESSLEWMISTCTAAQRAEAFLKTIGRWEGK